MKDWENASTLRIAQVTELRYIAIAESDGREFVMAATDGGAGVPQDQRAAEDQTAADGAATGDLAGTDNGAGAGGVTAGGDGGRSAGESGRAVATRASDRERDAVVQRVQDAFAEGRLNDDEFDERSRAALTARTHADLDALLADLPVAPTAPGPAPV